VKESVYVPGGVVVPTLIFRVEDPEPVTDNGVTLEMVPAGSPVTVILTGFVNPLDAATLIPKLVLPPAKRALVLGVAEM